MLDDQFASLSLYFANQLDKIALQDIKLDQFSWSLQSLVQDFGLNTLIVLDQMHVETGLIVDSQMALKSSWFKYQGDFLITKQKNIALIVLTADCVPLILYDKKNHVVGLIHAGWRGSYAGVVQKAFHTLQTQFNSQADNIHAFFGPSARGCCYQVMEKFRNDFVEKYPEQFNVFVKNKGTWYFDNSCFLQESLKKIGINEQNIYTNNALCTICNVEFCSFRRQKQQADRQVTFVALR